jgi:NAD(P)-dependent dehydrogenase (short-subunit alcohol dehydrogenase family)
MNSNGKFAIVTGGGTGVGRHTALALVQDGYSVAIAGRRVELLEETKAEAGEARERVLVVPTDIRDRDAVGALFAKTREAFGRLDLLFNNAGMGVPRTATEDLAYEDWKMVVDINVTGSFLCTQEAIRIMKSQDPMGGRIINNGSISAHTPRPDSVAYTATKHAITGLTKCTSLDGRKYNIACGQVDIGNAATPMTARMSGGVPQPDGRMVAEPRFDVDHVARAIVHMASLPLDTNILFMTIMANEMPFVGRG